MTTFVLLHGAFHGAWCWRDVSPILRAAGHNVFTPTQTGVGEKAHLLRHDITLDVFVEDVVAVLEAEEMTDAVLVGHSFGGNAITGAAERVPGRIRSLIYLDSMVPESGVSPLETLTTEVAERRRRLAAESGGLSIPPPAPDAFGVPEGEKADWLRRRLTPQPFGVFDSALTLERPPGNGLPCTYVVCTAPLYLPLERHRARVRTIPGWTVREFAASHDAMVTHPRETAELLMELAP